MSVLTAKITSPDVLMNLKLKNQLLSYQNPRYQFQKVFVNQHVAVKTSSVNEIALRMAAVPDLRPDSSQAVQKLRELKLALLSPRFDQAVKN